MNYSEIFYSIQGEGKLMGIPSVFFRTSGCNLRCWWCDTPYTSHNPEKNHLSIKDAIISICTTLKSNKCNHLVITGGEPYIQKDAVSDICKKLKKQFSYIHITIETNGTIHYLMEADLISISPKLSGSEPTDNQISKGSNWQKKHDNTRINYNALREFITGTTNYQFKFVPTEEYHESEIIELQQKLNIPNHRIYVMPEGTTSKDITKNQSFVADMCLRNGWRYSDRLHVRIWNDKRGV